MEAVENKSQKSNKSRCFSVNHYQCPECAMTCPNPSALKHHIRYKHSSERPYACEFCDYRYVLLYKIDFDRCSLCILESRAVQKHLFFPNFCCLGD